MKLTTEYLDSTMHQLLEHAKAMALKNPSGAMQLTQSAQNVVMVARVLAEMPGSVSPDD